MVGDLLFVPCEQAGFTSAQGLDASPRPGAADRDQENLTELELCESLRGHVCEVRMVRADHMVHHMWRDIDLGQPPQLTKEDYTMTTRPTPTRPPEDGSATRRSALNALV